MRAIALLGLLLAPGCAPDPLDEAARSYVALVHAREAKGADVTVPANLLDAVERLAPSPRAAHLARQLRALDAQARARARSFDEESRLLYGIVAPGFDPDAAEAVRRELDALLPGEGGLRTRLLDFQKRAAVPEEKLPALFGRAIEECRRRTRDHVALPDAEGVTLELVRGAPWPSFSRYLGSYRSVVSVNRDYPLPLPKLVEIAAHEAYPGHHLQSVLLERDLVRARGLVEYGVETEVGPDALVREGLASVAFELVFPDEERLAFEKDVLYPLAGLDPAEAERHARVEALTRRLARAQVDVARRYLDGELDRVQSVLRLERDALAPDPWSFLRFVDRYRTYVVTYTAGADEARARLASAPDPWRAYSALLFGTHDET